MIKNKIIFGILSIFIIIILCSCSYEKTDNTKPENTIDLFAMDTYMSLKAYGDNGQTALQKASEKIKLLEATMSVTNEKSEIFRLNNANGVKTEISADTGFLIKRSLEINQITGGVFDITLYPVSREWGFTTGKYKVPSNTRINELLKNVGSENIILNTDENFVLLENDANIDLGGIAKGYAGKCAADIIKSEGITSAILNMGGNVQTVGTKPDGSSWRVGIQDPDDGASLVGTVEIADKAVVTSGGYERYFEDDEGNIYCHILDPKTGYPAVTDILSVTVIGSDGTTCDAMSTSLFVMGVEKSVDYLKSEKDYDVVILSNDNKLYITNGVINNFKAIGKFSEYTIITI